MWNDSPSGGVGAVGGGGVGIGEAVDAAEVERLVPDVELLQPGQARAHHDVALGAGLERAPLSQVQHALEHLACLAAHRLETIVGAVEELLLILQIGMVRHVRPFLPRPSGKRFSLGDGRRPGTQRPPPTMSRMLISTMNDVPGYG